MELIENFLEFIFATRGGLIASPPVIRFNMVCKVNVIAIMLHNLECGHFKSIKKENLEKVCAYVQKTY